MAGLLDKSAPKRISESIIYLKLKYPNYKWTRKEIAEYSGTTFESVARVISSLEKMGLLKRLGRDFLITDHEAVLSLSEKDFFD